MSKEGIIFKLLVLYSQEQNIVCGKVGKSIIDLTCPIIFDENFDNDL